MIIKSLIAHANNNKCPISLEKILQIIKSYDNRVRAIIYCHWHGTSNVYNRVKDLPFVIVDINNDILPRRKARDKQIVKNTNLSISNPNSNIDYFPLYWNISTILTEIISKKRQRNLINADVERKKAKLFEVSCTFTTGSWASWRDCDFVEVQSYSLSSESMPPKTSSSRDDKCPKWEMKYNPEIKTDAAMPVMSGIMPLELELKLLTYLIWKKTSRYTSTANFVTPELHSWSRKNLSTRWKISAERKVLGMMTTNSWEKSTSPSNKWTRTSMSIRKKPNCPF